MMKISLGNNYCSFCQKANCSNPQKGLFVLDPDTLNTSGPDYVLGAPRNGKSKKILIEKIQPLPRLITIQNKKYVDFEGKLNESAWLRCANLLEEIGEIKASEFAMDVAHRLYLKKVSPDEKMNCLSKLYQIMYS